MYTQLLAHKKYLAQQIAHKPNSAQREQLYQYHLARVSDFQHERLIHLLVTLFFSLLLVASVTAWLLASAAIPALFIPLGALTIILFALDVAYIIHYYHLENGVQSLYAITEQFKP